MSVQQISETLKASGSLAMADDIFYDQTETSFPLSHNEHADNESHTDIHK